MRAGAEAHSVESLLKTHGKRLYNLAYRMCGDAHLAEDLVQESMIEIERSLPGFRGESSFYSWAYKITLRTCLRKTRGMDLRRQAEGALLGLEQSPSEEPDSVAGDSPGPADELVEKAMLAEIREKCHYFVTFRLTEEQRVTLLLRDLFEFSYADIAYLLDISEDVVRSRLSRARASLDRHFTERCSWIKPGNPCHCESRVGYVLSKYPSLAQKLHVRTNRPEYNRLVAEQIGRRIRNESDIIASFPMLDFKGRKTLEAIAKNTE